MSSENSPIGCWTWIAGILTDSEDGGDMFLQIVRFSLNYMVLQPTRTILQTNHLLWPILVFYSMTSRDGVSSQIFFIEHPSCNEAMALIQLYLKPIVIQDAPFGGD
jgi:hypothetical protein